MTSTQNMIWLLRRKIENTVGGVVLSQYDAETILRCLKDPPPAERVRRLVGFKAGLEVTWKQYKPSNLLYTRRVEKADDLYVYTSSKEAIPISCITRILPPMPQDSV